MKKVAILIQRAFKDKFEPANLRDSFNKRGWQADILCLEDIYDLYSTDGPHFIHTKFGDLAQYDVLLVREVFGLFKYAINVANYMANKGKIVIDNNLQIEKMMINKLTDALRLSNAGIAYPKSYHAHSKDNYIKMLPQIEKECGYPLLVKHRSAGKGYSIYKVEDRIDLENLLDTLVEDGRLGKFYIQEFLPLAFDYRVLYIADQVLGVMRRIPKKGEFRANFSLGGSVEPAELTPEIKAISEKAAKVTNCNFAGVDVVVTKDGRHFILEVNRTPGFEGFTKAHKLNVANYFIDYAEKLIAEKEQS